MFRVEQAMPFASKCTHSLAAPQISTTKLTVCASSINVYQFQKSLLKFLKPIKWAYKK